MKHSLIPFPAFVLAGTGNFVVSNTTEISIETSVELEVLSNYLVQQIGEAAGIRDIINSATGEQKGVSLRLALDGDTGLGEEGYELSLSANATRLSANHLVGLFCGIQTLCQLLPTHHTQNVSLPTVSMRDTPRFRWRGTSSLWRI
jgi:hexosaminidase